MPWFREVGPSGSGSLLRRVARMGPHRTSCFGRTPGAVPNELPQILDLTCAKPLCDRMAALLAECGPILDASAVQRMSTPSVQLLLAAGRAAISAGISFRIVNV
jgi:hypothetical protein